MAITDKDIADLKTDIDELKKDIKELKNARKINEIMTGVADIIAGTVATGDATADSVINDIRTKVNKLFQNSRGQ